MDTRDSRSGNADGTGTATGDGPPPAPSASADRPSHGTRRVRSLHEVRDAMKAAGLLRPPPSTERGRALFALLVPYRRRIVEHGRSSAPPVLEGLAKDRLGETIQRHAAPVLLDVLLPACRRHLLDRLVRRSSSDAPDDPDPEGMPPAAEVAATMRHLSDALGGAGRLHSLAVIEAVQVECRALVEPLARLTLDPAETIANPALVRDLSRTLLRLEVLRMVVEALGLRHAAVDEAAFQSRRSARLALRHAATAIRGLLSTDEAVILRLGLPEIAAVDSLIVVSLRILDALADEEEERTHFVPLMDETALEEFVDAGSRLAGAILELLRRVQGEAGFDDAVFATMAGKLKWLHQFCARLRHDRRPPALDEMQDLIVLQTTMLARRASDLLVDSLPLRRHAPISARSLVARGWELADAIAGMNRGHVHAALVERLEAVQQALDRDDGL